MGRTGMLGLSALVQSVMASGLCGGIFRVFKGAASPVLNGMGCCGLQSSSPSTLAHILALILKPSRPAVFFFIWS